MKGDKKEITHFRKTSSLSESSLGCFKTTLIPFPEKKKKNEKK